MAFHYSPKLVTSGLTLAVDAGNTNSYPGTGTSWFDLSGNTNTNTLVNGPSFNPLNGGCLTFDGSDDYADTGKLASQIGMFDQSYTVFSVCYPTSFANDKNMLGTDQTAFRQGLHLTFRGGAIYMGHYSSDFSAGTGTLNAWNFITFRYDISTSGASIFKDSVLQGTGGIQSFIGTTNILIGREFGGGGLSFQGNIATTLIYGRALSQNEITQNYNALKARFGL